MTRNGVWKSPCDTIHLRGVYTQGVVSSGPGQVTEVDVESVADPVVEIEMSDPIAGIRKVSLAEAVGCAVEDGYPVRQPASYHGQWSKPGWFYMSSMDRMVGYESLFESWVLLDLDFAGQCAQVLPQPCRFHFDRSRLPYRHVPDYLVRDVTGARTLIDVKGARRAAEPRNQLVFGLTKDACDRLGWSFRLATEPAPAYFRNVRFLAGVRHRRFGMPLDGPVAALAGEIAARGGMRWVDAEALLASDVAPWLLPRVVARALWCHMIEADLTVPISGATLLLAPSDVHAGFALAGGS